MPSSPDVATPLWKPVVGFVGLAAFAGLLARARNARRKVAIADRGEKEDHPSASLHPPPGSDADWEQFRTNGKAVVDFIADYFQRNLRTYPVKSQVKPGYLSKTPLGTDSQRIISNRGDDFSNVLQDVRDHICLLYTSPSPRDRG